LTLVRPAMVSAANRSLELDGARGVLQQPATGVPFKVFARLAGARGVSLPAFLLWAAAGRSLRFVLLAGLAAVLARACPGLVARRYWLLTMAWALGFGVSLWRIVRLWEQRT
jgi:hypothetical protein